jgi:hypothetical protein
MLYTVAEASEFLKIPASRLFTWIKLGKIIGHKESNTWHISERTLEKLWAESLKKTKPKEQPLCRECGKPAGYNKAGIPQTYCSKKCSDKAYRAGGVPFAIARTTRKKQ